ncbi:MAG: hypothetical protein ACOCRO_11575 [Halanaerobiales bacterium]
MVKVYILKIEPIYEDLYIENKLYCKRIKEYKVNAMVHIDDIGVPDIEKGTYTFDPENMPDSIIEIENRIRSMYAIAKD